MFGNAAHTSIVVKYSFIVSASILASEPYVIFQRNEWAKWVGKDNNFLYLWLIMCFTAMINPISSAISTDAFVLIRLTDRLNRSSTPCIIGSFCFICGKKKAWSFQKDVIAPYVFLYLVEDRLHAISTSSKGALLWRLLQFADALKLSFNIRTLNDCTLFARRCVTHASAMVSNFFFFFFLLIKPDKAKVLSICKKRESILNTYVLGSTTVLRVYVFRDLGIYFDDHLSFSYHVSQIVASAVRMLGSISRLTKYFFFISLSSIRIFCSLKAG